MFVHIAGEAATLNESLSEIGTHRYQRRHPSFKNEQLNPLHPRADGD